MVIHVFEDDFIPLPIYFVSCSERHVQENVCRSAGFRDIGQLLFVLDGEGVLQCNGSEYPLKKGCAFYLDSHVPHAYHGNGELITAWITWRGDGANVLRTYIGQKSFFFCEHIDVKKYAAQIAQITREYFLHKREGSLSALTYSLIIGFFDEQKTGILTGMEVAVRYMEAHFARHITISELAAACHCSRSTFCKRFREEYGCTAFEKLTEIRLCNADAILRSNPHDKISHVAKLCGFDDPSYFCKAYKKKFHITPNQARMQ